MIFDSHAHYDDDKFNEDRETLLESLNENGIGYVVNVGSSMESCRKTLELSEKYSFVYCALGIHPSDTGSLTEEDYEWLKNAIKGNKKAVAVGEIGLDYYWEEPEHDIQKKWFERQIALAQELKKPMIIHSRDAAKDTYEIMKAAECDRTGGVIHCFSYSVEEARKYLDMGFYLGIGGVVTFRNGRKMREVVEYAPLDRLLLETDCPYLAPEPNRGKRNSSLNLTYVAEEIARIKNISKEEVIDITMANARAMYSI